MADSDTGTVGGARDHARAQAGSAVAAAVDTKPTIPATAATDLPSGVDPATVVWDETLRHGGYASRVVRRGAHVRITQVDGDPNVSLVLHHAARPIERLNVADTVKLQWNAYPGAGSLLLSDMGRVLATILPGSDGAVDLLCGASLPRGRERLIVGLAKHGLSRRDLPPAANLFTAVRVDPEGRMDVVPPTGGASAQVVTLRAELDLLVTVAVTDHPLDHPLDDPGDPDGGRVDGMVRLTAWQGEPAGPDDPARTATPESRRAFENTDDVLPTLLAGGAPWA